MVKSLRILAFALLPVLVFVACGKHDQSAPLPSGIIVTNLIHTNQTFFSPTGGVETVILLTNDIYFGHKADTKSVSVDLPGHYAAWIYYDTNNKPRRMIHQFYGTNRYWLTDINADGIPDTRVNYNDGPNRGSKSIFVKGEWIDAKLLDTNATAFVDQKPTQFKFSDGKWATADPQE